MDSKSLKTQYLQFFEARGHHRLPSAPLLPENDPTALFTSAGMQPLVPNLLGEPHPLGRRLVDVQACLRTNDIDEVGDVSHLTFFEMLGNWSLGDYFKAESLAWSYEFLTGVLGLPAARLSATVFAGDADAPRDDESAAVWQRLGLPLERIYYLPKSDNWWGPVGRSGPCGPDSEIFFDTGSRGGRPEHAGCQPGCPCGRWFEIWNNVFMEYHQRPDGGLDRLEQRNVDTGMGVERTVAVLGGHDDVFEMNALWPLVERLQLLSGRAYSDDPRPFRVVADHVRAASLAIADGAAPSNVEAGYVVRRMIRRAVRYGRQLGLRQNLCGELSSVVASILGDSYPRLSQQSAAVAEVLDREETRFAATLERGLREYEKVAAGLRSTLPPGGTISGEDAFNLFETFGFPLPLTVEIAREQGLQVDEARFEALFAEHKALSRQGSDRKFRGGLAERSEQTTRLHTATHLLHAALRQALGSEVRQRGSNITAERLRFDFAYTRQLTPEEVHQVENTVNAQIARDLPVTVEVMPLDQALAQGALAFFGEKYGEQVKVYTIGDFSKEVCGGPHVARTGELGGFRITKEEAVAQDVRRIRATLDYGVSSK
jgi:alanyl-tRNA synthetase